MTLLEIAIKEFILSKIAQRAKLLGLDAEQVVVNDTQSLVEIGIFDSINFLELLADIGNNFKIEIDLSEFDPGYFTTIEGLISIVSSTSTNKKASVGAILEHDGKVICYDDISCDGPYREKLTQLFREMYNYFATLGLDLPLKKNGEYLWLDSLRSTIGKTNRIIGCIDSGKLIAFIHAAIKMLPPYVEAKQLTGFIAGIYVEPPYRKHGIARELVNKARTWFESQGIESIELQVVANNVSAINFWRSMKFNEELLQMRSWIIQDE